MNFFGLNNTMKTNKSVNQTKKLLTIANSTLGSGNLNNIVKLPEGEDYDEWIAVNLVDFFSQISMLYGTLIDCCTDKTCPIMNAGSKWEFHWPSDSEFKRPIKLSAPQYVEKLMNWIRLQIDNEQIFPQNIGVGFNKKFQPTVKIIFKRLSRVLGHLYNVHYQTFVDLDVDSILNTCFKHFICFVLEFNLISKKDLAPIEDLIVAIKSDIS
ncbi:Mob1/phocein [Globomyces pollinis-pini]|nr:Mob1/phocein [Globomyces pollinis-pini]